MTKPEVTLLSHDLVAAAVIAGVGRMTVVIDTMSGIDATGLPPELIDLLKIDAIQVTIGLEGFDGASTEVRLWSRQTGDNTAAGEEFHESKVDCGRTAVAEALRRTIANVSWQNDGTKWTVEDLKAAIRLLGEEP